MPDDGDDNPGHEQKGGRKPPENPAPHLRPQGFLRNLGDAYGRRSGPVQARSQQSAPPRQLSEKDLQAEGKRERLRHLQAKGLLVINKEHNAKLQKSREAFDEQHREEILAMQKERAAITDRRSGGVLRAQWYQFSGRAAHDDERLKQLDQQEQQLEVRREAHLQPLQEAYREELAGFVEVQRFEREHLEYRIQHEIYGNADHSSTHEHQGGEHEAGDHEAGRDGDDTGRER